MTDIGTGSYTIIAQTAAETMGVPLDQVQVTSVTPVIPPLPVPAASGARQAPPRACTRRASACAARWARNSASTATPQTSPMAASSGWSDHQAGGGGNPVGGGRHCLRRLQTRLRRRTYAGHFCEVAVHAYTGETRIRRMLAVCDGGRILNPLSARSQVIGGMVMGAGAT